MRRRLIVPGLGAAALRAVLAGRAAPAEGPEAATAITGEHPGDLVSYGRLSD